MMDETLPEFEILVPPEAPKDRNYDTIDPIDNRYYRPETARYLSERARITYQACVEGALAHTLAGFGVCSASVASEIIAATAEVTPDEVYLHEYGRKADPDSGSEEIPATKHDIKALMTVIKNHVSPAAQPYVHMTATSFDIISTANALQLKEVMENVTLPQLVGLEYTLTELTERYAGTPQIGRTHGQHGVPITFGFAIAEYVSRLGESIEELHRRAEGLRGKFSGAVGAYNASSLLIDNPVDFEHAVLAKLGLSPAEVSTQIAPPEPTIRLLDELVNVAGIMANLATNMRQLQRPEIAEVQEGFDKDQSGSSTMAQKKNPISFENVVSLHKEAVGQLVTAKLNAISEHQRDLTDSAASRFYPILVTVVTEMARRLDGAMLKLGVFPEVMARNLALTEGAIASEALLTLLSREGHPHAHDVVRKLVHGAQETNTPIHEAFEHPTLKPYWDNFTEEEREIIAQPETKYIGLATIKAAETAISWRSRIQAREFGLASPK